MGQGGQDQLVRRQYRSPPRRLAETYRLFHLQQHVRSWRHAFLLDCSSVVLVVVVVVVVVPGPGLVVVVVHCSQLV